MKLYLDNENLITPFFKSYSLFLEMEIGKWQIVDNIQEADIIAIPETKNTNYEYLKSVLRPRQILLILEIYHVAEYMGDNRYQNILDRYAEITDKVVYVHTNLKNKNDPRMVHFDHLFWRQKLYCTEYEKGIDLDQRSWTTDCNKKIYELSPEITKYDVGKKFLSLINIVETSFEGRMIFRRMLKSFLQDYYHKEGFINDPANDKIFVPNSVDGIFGHLTRHTMGGIWYPVSDYYYNSSIVSIYIETITQWDMMHSVTEKTFDPLIKGNFILPFGTCEFIKNLKEHYGFHFPDWIDYSYDEVPGDHERFVAYINSIKKLMKYSRSELYDLCIKDMHILEKNKQVFFNTPYDSLYKKVYNCIQYHGWHK